MPLILIADVVIQTDEILYGFQEVQNWGGKVHYITRVFFKNDPDRKQAVNVHLPLNDFYEQVNKEVALVHTIEQASGNKQT